VKVLIVGGTQFLGRHFVESLISLDCDISIFHRGFHGNDLFPEVFRLIGNRDNDRDIFKISDIAWDLVIDTCGFFPDQISRLGNALRKSDCFYVYISSVNRYSDLSSPWKAESSEDVYSKSNHRRELTPESYGFWKARCEEEVINIFDGRALIIRSGCIVGPYDEAERFEYWVRRISAGGRVLIPGSSQMVWQIIDARDLVDWAVSMFERRLGGIFNVVGPNLPISAGDLFGNIVRVLGVEAEPVWIETNFLKKQEGHERWLDLAEWVCLPPSMANLYRVSNQKAKDAGLSFRSLDLTIQDTMRWFKEVGEPKKQLVADGLEGHTLTCWDSQGIMSKTCESKL
jgi:2'-hydroxyisoflavone reductase